MKSIQVLKFLLFVFLGQIVTFQAYSISQPAPYVEGVLLIQTDGTNLNDILESTQSSRSNSKQKLKIKRIIPQQDFYIYSFDTDQKTTTEKLHELRSHPNIIHVQYNHKLTKRRQPNDLNYEQQWSLSPSDSNQRIDIGVQEAWDITTGGKLGYSHDILVAIIDDGFNIEHPDLSDNIFINSREVPNNKIDDDQNGYIDDYKGWNAQTNNDSLRLGTHGTSVAGVIGAVGNNEIGVSGINWSVKILPLLLDEEFTEAGLITNYLYAYEMRKRWNESLGKEGGFVVATNSSWGIDAYFPSDFPIWCSVYDTLYSVGILNCVATGNSSIDVDQFGDLPSLCESESLIVVTSIDESNQLQGSYGSTSVDVAAPGQNIFTLRNQGYGFNSGTSFAAPVVSGMVALMYSIPSTTLLKAVLNQPVLTAKTVKDVILSTVEPLDSLQNLIVTKGKVNAYQALTSFTEIYGLDSIEYCAIDSLESNDVYIDTFLIFHDSVFSGNNQGYRPSTVFADSVEQGRFLPFAVFSNIQYPDSVQYALWMDINQDTVFSERERLAIDTSDNRWYSSIFIPENIDTGYYHFRIAVAALSDSLNPCGENMMNYEFEDYVIYVKTNPLLCPSPPTVDSLMIKDTSATILWSMVDSSVAYVFRYRKMGSSEWEDEMVDTAVMFTINGLEECSFYEFQVRSVCFYDTSAYSAPYEFQTDCKTNVDEANFSSVVQLYPNPWSSSQQLIISLPELWIHRRSSWQIEIFSITGQQLYTQQIDQMGHNLSVSPPQLDPGLYFIKIDNGENYALKKFIAQ